MLRKENNALKDHPDQIEMNQLRNNVIITGILEQAWESYIHTKQRVIYTIATSVSSSNDPDALLEAKVDISYCTKLGRQWPNYDCPISVTFQRKEDKYNLLKGKCNLPAGIYINEQFPIHIK